jgi:adenine phosphoribosyltransferase
MPDADRLELADYIRSIPDFPKPGILFRDITPLLSSPEAFSQAVARLAEAVRPWEPEVIVAVEARGFLFAAPLALELGAALVPVRKPGKLPYEKISYTYDLEYGTDTLEMHVDAIPAGAKVLVVDDLLATGGTVEACCRLVEKAGGQIAGVAFVIELAFLGGASKVAEYPHVSLISFD